MIRITMKANDSHNSCKRIGTNEDDFASKH